MYRVLRGSLLCRSTVCTKEPMAADRIVRLSKVEVYPQHLDEYMKYATEVGKSPCAPNRVC